jgi:S1-C subfamily serine protease
MRTLRWFLGCGCLPVALLALPAVGQQDRDLRRARELSERARTKVLILRAGAGTAVGAATGFLIGPGIVLTVGHAVAGMSGIRAWVNGVAYRASVLAEHPAHDIAILSLRAPELLVKPLELSRGSRDLVELEKLIVLSSDAHLLRGKGDPSERVTILATFRQHVRLRDPSGRVGPMLALNASVEHGDSGSPVLRLKDGAVVGVLSSRATPGEDGVSRSAYAVPVEAVHLWMDAARQLRRPDEQFYLFQR